MASYQAQYILNEFSTPSVRSNHNSALSRDNGPANSNVTPNGVRYVHIVFFSLVFYIILSYLLLGIFSRRLSLPPPVKQREAVRATWKRVTPQTKVRGVALQPWPTALPSVPSPPRKARRPLRLRPRGSTRFPCITPNTSPACRRLLPARRRWTKSRRSWPQTSRTPRTLTSATTMSRLSSASWTRARRQTLKKSPTAPWKTESQQPLCFPWKYLPASQRMSHWVQDLDRACYCAALWKRAALSTLQRRSTLTKGTALQLR